LAKIYRNEAETQWNVNGMSRRKFVTAYKEQPNMRNKRHLSPCINIFRVHNPYINSTPFS